MNETETLARLQKSAVIAGAANNQLAGRGVHGRAVMEKGILYAPDFLVNAGGINLRLGTQRAMCVKRP